MGRPKAPRGQARQRVLDAALVLFSDHGVKATSLQMIADRLGVTKAAVYHQFPAKEDIAAALLERLFDTMSDVVSLADDAPAANRRDVALGGLVDLMIEQRHVMSAFYRDPELERLVARHPEHTAVTQRLAEHLLGPGASQDLRTRVSVSVLGAGLIHAVVDDDLAAVPEQDLRASLVETAKRILG